MNKLIEFLSNTGNSIDVRGADKLLIPNSRNKKVLSLDQSRDKAAAAISSYVHEGMQSHIVSVSSSDADKFAKKVAEIAYGLEFLTEFGNKIDSPTSEESEDEFVSRAKKTLADMLRRKLGKES